MNLFTEYNNKIKTFLKLLEKNKIILLTPNLESITTQIPPKNQKADFACNIALVLSKINNKPPYELAFLLKEELLKKFEEFESVEVAKPGFLNVTFKNLFWKNQSIGNVNLHVFILYIFLRSCRVKGDVPLDQ